VAVQPGGVVSGRLEQQEHSGLHSQVASILLDLELVVVRESLAAPESLEAVLCNLRQLNAKMFLVLHVQRALHNNHNTYKLNLESSKKLVEWMEIA